MLGASRQNFGRKQGVDTEKLKLHRIAAGGSSGRNQVSATLTITGVVA